MKTAWPCTRASRTSYRSGNDSGSAAGAGYVLVAKAFRALSGSGIGSYVARTYAWTRRMRRLGPRTVNESAAASVATKQTARTRQRTATW